MANEAILRVRTNDPIDMDCADHTGIEKGTVMKISGAKTVAASDAGTANVFGGILTREKIANDGRTKAAVMFRGIYDMVCCSGAATIAAGQIVAQSGVNLIRSASEAEVNAGKGIGKALESGTAGDTINVFVGQF